MTIPSISGWNKLLYLWGVFRGREKNNLEGLATFEKISCVSKLNHDLSTPIVSGLFNLPLPDISENVVGICNGEKPPSERNLHHSIDDGEVLKKHISCSLYAGGYRNLYDVTTIPVSHPEPRVQIDIEQLPSEMEVDLNSLVSWFLLILKQ